MSAGRQPVTVTLADVTPERVEWVWPGRLPAGKLVVLDGDPAVGKSTLTVDWAARVSTGSPWPDGEPCPRGSVLILSAEDGLADTIRPRLDAAGGDAARVHAMTAVAVPGDDPQRRSRPVTLDDAPEIEAAIRDKQATLVIVDVLMAYLPSGTDSHRDQDVRRVLAVLAAIAERTKCSIVLLRHLNKAPGGNPLYRGGGSIGIVGAARAAMLAAVDPDDENRRVLAVTKTNLSAAPPALGYRLVDSPADGCARVEWLGTTGHQAVDLLTHRDDDERAECDEAGAWLVAYLDSHGGTAPAAEITRAAGSALGLPPRAVRRARARAGITTRKGGFGAGWNWVSPTEGDTEGAQGANTQGAVPFVPLGAPSDSRTRNPPNRDASPAAQDDVDRAWEVLAATRLLPDGARP